MLAKHWQIWPIVSREGEEATRGCVGESSRLKRDCRGVHPWPFVRPSPRFGSSSPADFLLFERIEWSADFDKRFISLKTITGQARLIRPSAKRAKSCSKRVGASRKRPSSLENTTHRTLAARAFTAPQFENEEPLNAVEVLWIFLDPRGQPAEPPDCSERNDPNSRLAIPDVSLANLAKVLFLYLILLDSLEHVLTSGNYLELPALSTKFCENLGEKQLFFKSSDMFTFFQHKLNSNE